VICKLCVPSRWGDHMCECWLRHIRFGHCELPEPVALRLYTRLQHALKVGPTIKTAAVNFGICPPIVMSSTGSPSGASSPFALRASLSSHVRNWGCKKYLKVTFLNTRFFNVYSSPFSTSLVPSALFATRSSNLHSRPSS
jgi:hypothetical protein